MFKTMYSLNIFDPSKNTLLMSPTTPNKLVKTCKELKYDACCVMDYHSLSSVVEFFSVCKKNEIKPIIGCRFFSKDGFYSLIAKNKNGYFNLIKLLSESHDPSHYDNGPQVNLGLVEKYSKDLIMVAGGLNSELSHFICKYDEVYSEMDENRIKSLLNIDVDVLVERYKSIFKDDLYLEYFDYQFPFNTILSGIVKDLSSKYKIKLLKHNNPHYCSDQHMDHLTTLSIGMKTNMNDLIQELKLNEHSYIIPTLNDYVLPPTQELKELYDSCESYDIFQPPKLPKFDCTSEIEHLKQLCRDGWKKKNKGWGQNYIDRVKYELSVIEKANLSGYFLIVADYIRWAKNNNILVGPGRGSSSGSLIAYLMDITEINPISYNLIFERFYNEGRNTPGNIELPDIDTDFPINDREKIIEYIRNKYSSEKVGQVCTFGRMMGASVLKEVFRVYKACSFTEANKITQEFPQEAKIAGDLEEMEQSNEEYSIIKWVLENKPESLVDYCTFDGEYKGPLAQYFEQAIRLEGVCKTQGKHAAAVVISPTNLNEICPMIHDKNSDNKITGLDMEGLKKIGLNKFDILGVASLDKCQEVSNMIGEK